MNKKGQLIQLEFHFAWIGFLVGIVGAMALTYLGNKEIIPFQIPAVCGAMMLNPSNKKAQLLGIEMKFFFIGFFLGFASGLVLTYLSSAGTLPFKIPLVCS